MPGQRRRSAAEIEGDGGTPLIAALIGMTFLKERFGARRIAAAAVVAAGMVLIST